MTETGRKHTLQEETLSSSRKREEMRERFNNFMRGRYGVDDLSKCLLILSVVSMVLNMLTRLRIFNVMAIVLIVLIYLRMLSRDYAARSAENRKYLEVKDRIKNGEAAGMFADVFAGQKKKMQDRRVNHIYRCPSCSQKIRVPRGKGKIIVTCPKCKTEFTRKS